MSDRIGVKNDARRDISTIVGLGSELAGGANGVRRGAEHVCDLRGRNRSAMAGGECQMRTDGELL
jgi:hypothetical protein